MTLSEGLFVFSFARVTRYNLQRVREAVQAQEQESALVTRAERAELLVRVLTDEIERRERGDRERTRKRSRSDLVREYGGFVLEEACSLG
jgi:DNA polymerase elongation subunit (family B)